MIVTCVQRNGEHLHVERWVYIGVLNGTVKDPPLVRIVRGAVRFIIGYDGWGY